MVILREINDDEVQSEMPPAASRKLDKMEIDLTNLLNKVQHFDANQAAMKEDLKEIKAMVVNSMDIMRTIQQDVLLFLKEIQNNLASEVMKQRKIMLILFLQCFLNDILICTSINRKAEKKNYLQS